MVFRFCQLVTSCFQVVTSCDQEVCLAVKKWQEKCFCVEGVAKKQISVVGVQRKVFCCGWSGKRIFFDVAGVARKVLWSGSSHDSAPVSSN